METTPRHRCSSSDFEISHSFYQAFERRFFWALDARWLQESMIEAMRIAASEQFWRWPVESWGDCFADAADVLIEIDWGENKYKAILKRSLWKNWAGKEDGKGQSVRMLCSHTRSWVLNPPSFGPRRTQHITYWGDDSVHLKIRLLNMTRIISINGTKHKKNGRLMLCLAAKYLCSLHYLCYINFWPPAYGNNAQCAWTT